MQQFQALARWLDQWLGPLLLIPQDGAPLHGQTSGTQDCFAVLVAVHLVLGTLLCSAVVHVAEKHSRATFLLAAADELGAWQQQAPLQVVAEELCLPPDEVLRTAMFDCRLAWLWFFALLPHLSAIVWLSVRNFAAASM